MQCCTEFRIKQEDSIKRIEIISQIEEKFSENICSPSYDDVDGDDNIGHLSNNAFNNGSALELFLSQKIVNSIDPIISLQLSSTKLGNNDIRGFKFGNKN